jgi:hypothetical protein
MEGKPNPNWRDVKSRLDQKAWYERLSLSILADEAGAALRDAESKAKK